jgi:hypothetical protein
VRAAYGFEEVLAGLGTASQLAFTETARRRNGLWNRLVIISFLSQFRFAASMEHIRGQQPT